MRLPRQTAQTTEDSTGLRHYLTPQGLLPSVTSILSRTSAWAGQGASPAAMAARARGRLFHAEMQARLEQGEEGQSPYFSSLTSFWPRLGEIWLVEGPLWHSQGFAGTVDCVAEVDGVLSVIDWKTTDEPRSPESVIDPHLQVAAYRAALREIYGLDVPQTLIVFAPAVGEAQVMPADDPDARYADFLARLLRFRQKFAMSAQPRAVSRGRSVGVGSRSRS